MTGVCPSCGVTVVTGYVRCPKCGAGLPMGGSRFRRIKRTSGGPGAGGTSMVREGFPLLPVLAAVVVAGGIIAYFALRDDKPAPKLVSPARPNEAAPAVVPRRPAQPPAPAPTPAPSPAPSTAPAGDPVAAAAELERSLKRQRLWSTVQVTGARLDVRSASCREPAMAQAIAGSQSALRGGGLTRLRCLEQSGAVVFERDL
jgi:hypothetical protein